MTISELEEQLKDLEGVAKPLKDQLKPIDKQIKECKSSIKEVKKNEKYKDFDPILKKYYTFELPEGRGDDWTDLTGWHGGNTREMADTISEFFDGYEPYDRHIEMDVYETVFGADDEDTPLTNYFKEYSRPEYANTLKSLNLSLVEWDDDVKPLKTFKGLSEQFTQKIKDFINVYTSIQVTSCIYDW